MKRKKFIFIYRFMELYSFAVNCLAPFYLVFDGARRAERVVSNIIKRVAPFPLGVVIVFSVALRKTLLLSDSYRYRTPTICSTLLVTSSLRSSFFFSLYSFLQENTLSRLSFSLISMRLFLENISL